MGLTQTLAIASESFRLLRRDRIFAPASICGFMVAALANLSSGWSIEDFSKILIDVGGFGFTLTGSAVAMFWGVKLISDAREGGALEVQLAAPISRSQWLVGKYLGLAACLGLLGILLLVLWQALMLANDFGWMTLPQLTMFGAMYAGWLVTGALAMLLASLAGMGVAIFATIALWLAGQSSALILATLPSDTSDMTRQLVSGLARFWDLQQFNLQEAAAFGRLPAKGELLLQGAYGLTLVAALLSLSAVFFHRRDLT